MDDWKHFYKEKPDPGRLVQTRTISETIAWYEPECLITEWIKPDGAPIKSKVVQWKYAEKELQDKYGENYDVIKPKQKTT